MGAALAQRCSVNHQVIGLRRADLDLRHPETIKPILKALEFDGILCTAALTNLDACEERPDEAQLVNADAPGEIARCCAERGARLIHMSTDYVFSGEKPGRRVESDDTCPINVYGRTKLAGEQAVLAASPSFTVVRTSWIFGSDKPSFPDAVIRNALTSTDLQAIADKWSCPSYSEDLAAWMEPMIADDRYRGVFHLCNEGIASWLDYAEAALELAAEEGVPVKTTKVRAVSRVGFPGWKAQRPEHTALDTRRHQTLSGISPRPWSEALREHIRKQHVRYS